MKRALTSWQVYIQCRGGSDVRERLFHNIWKRYRKRLMYFVRNYVRSDAEDVFQEIMLKVFQNIEKFNPFYAFGTWIYTIARNHCVSHLGRRSMPVAVEDPETMPPGSGYASPESEMIREELFREIDRILATFSENNQQIAYLRFFEGMKHRDIARVMNIPTGTVKSRVHACRTRIKKALESDDERRYQNEKLL